MALLKYKAPKSQVWGHAVNRLSNRQLHDRSHLFMEDKCNIIKEDSATFGVVYSLNHGANYVSLIEELKAKLSSKPSQNDCQITFGDPSLNLRWNINNDEIETILNWTEKLPKTIASTELKYSLSKFIYFRWQHNKMPSENTGGLFAYHFGEKRYVTTQFVFESRQQYEMIKKYLLDIQLVELKDKNLK